MPIDEDDEVEEKLNQYLLKYLLKIRSRFEFEFQFEAVITQYFDISVRRNLTKKQQQVKNKSQNIDNKLKRFSS